ncbi:MAG TPA: amidohydrolase [Candidatus Binataceae bacterium]|nr:amidohydrolase [Candidatus Binataceae bacterium]
MAIHEEICRSIDGFRDRATDLGHQIHAHPELKFEERFAAELISNRLVELGAKVERSIGGLETAFRSSIGKPGPTVAILAEYDALPNGHSCGHNLICSAALASFAGLAAIRERLPGQVVILGTPAEEGGGGKIALLESGAFKDVDVAMMAHPMDGEFATINALATQHLRITFHGHAAHAALAPWAGASALAAVIQTFQSVDAARLHFHDGSRLHGIITNGGQAVNIVPEKTVCEFLARAPSSEYAREIAARVVRCADAAALATATTATHEVIGGYKNMINSLAVAHRYAEHSGALGVKVTEAPSAQPIGSTDMGDVSHALPAIHPVFRIADPGAGNCHEDTFEKLTDSPRAYEAMIRVAKAMALTAYDLLADSSLLEKAKTEFAARK